MMRPLPQEEVIQMYHETIRPLYAYVSQRVGGDVSLAEDLVQETWMRALDDWAKKEFQENLSRGCVVWRETPL